MHVYIIYTSFFPLLLMLSSFFIIRLTVIGTCQLLGADNSLIQDTRVRLSGSRSWYPALGLNIGNANEETLSDKVP